MKRIIVLTVLLLCNIISAQMAPGISVTKIKDNFYKLTAITAYSVNFLAFVTEEGILLVDTGHEETGKDIKKALSKISLGNESIKYIINTHSHIDHTGGNLALAGEPIIIGTDLLKKKLRSGPLVLNEFPDNAVPTKIFSDSTSIEFGGEKIRIIALPGSHDSTDVIVHFTKSGIVCGGDIVFGMSFPSIDSFTGNIKEYPEVLNKILKIVPSDVIFVTGHGENLSVGDLKKFREMIVKSIDIVGQEEAKGKTLMQMTNEDLLKEFKSFDGLLQNRAGMISTILKTGRNPLTSSTIEELYKVLINNNGAEAVKKYYNLKINYPANYFFGESPLVRVGYWLIKKGRISDAIEIFKLYVNEFPNSWNSYDSLGEAYAKAGDKKLAIENYEKSLKLNPENENAINALKGLKANN